jgi:hypothetical protein
MAVAPTREEIEIRAYELYLQCGCESGHEIQHWLEAEAELTNAQALKASEGQAAAPSSRQTPATAQAAPTAPRTAPTPARAEQQKSAAAGRDRR